jgi:hypoxanthine phosphoribosyltransferase
VDEEKKKILFTRSQLENAVSRLAREINEDYRGQKLLMVGILKGAFVFMADLIRHLDLDVSVDFVVLRSYGSSKTSSGEVQVIKDLHEPLEKKHVLIIEDIVDTGITLKYFYDLLFRRNPESLKICTLIDKKARREVDISVDYVGLEMEDGFIVGYGIDYDEKYRNLPEVWVLEE